MFLKKILYDSIYTYDLSGNLVEINRTSRLDVYANYPQQQVFNYNFNNELVEYTIDDITYIVDYNNGAPDKFKDFNLTSLTNNNNNISYEYNADGIRIKKNVNGVITTYKVFEGLIIEETKEGSAGYTIKYLYDNNNLLVGFIYNIGGAIG